MGSIQNSVNSMIASTGSLATSIKADVDKTKEQVAQAVGTVVGGPAGGKLAGDAVKATSGNAAETSQSLQAQARETALKNAQDEMDARQVQREDFKQRLEGYAPLIRGGK